MSMVFTQEEKTKMQETLGKVVADLRSIFEMSQDSVLKYKFKTIENGDKHEYCLIINDKESFISLCYCDWYMQLDKKHGNTYHIHKIKDYETAFEFLKKYEIIRKGLIELAKTTADKKKTGMSIIDEISSKYSKEAIIEVTMPETINQSSIEIVQENGQNVGRITIGSLSLKILASPSVKIVSKIESEKKKVKKG